MNTDSEKGLGLRLRLGILRGEKNEADKSVRLTMEMIGLRLFFCDANGEVDEFAGRDGHVLWQADQNWQTHFDTI